MKRILLNIVCVLSIIVPVILVARGTLLACFLALALFLLAFFVAKRYPHVYRNFYADTMRLITMFLE